MSAIDRLHTTAESHKRTLICEVMGRNAGWIAFHAGLSGGANVILIPEIEFDLDQVCDYIVRRFESQYSPIVVVAEGAVPKGGMPSTDGAPTDAFGHVRLGGIAHWLEGEIEQRTGHEARATVLGHVQRGGTPTAFDRVLATRFGLHAIDAAHGGQVGKDDRAAQHRHRARRPHRGDGGAEDGPGVALSRGRGLLRLIDGPPGARGAAALPCRCRLRDRRERDDRGTGDGLRQPAPDAGREGPRGGTRQMVPASPSSRSSGKAGAIEVRAQYLDDAKGAAWDPVAVGANARQAVQDSSAAAYIGELDSEPTRASVPITNDAGLVQVSPGAGAVDLTRPAAGYPNSPDRYRPSGSPNFARTVPGDDVVVDAAADWASELGATQAVATSDGSPFQNLAAAEFRSAASRARDPGQHRASRRRRLPSPAPASRPSTSRDSSG